MPDRSLSYAPHRLPPFVWRSAVLPILAGLGLFVFAIASSRSQPLDCAQPDPVGCPLPLDQPVANVMTGDTLIHRWLVQVPPSSDGGMGNLWVTMPVPPADYDLYIAAEDGTIVGRSIEVGPVDDMVPLTNIPAGNYVAIVVSPRCEKSNVPYALVASASRPPALAPVAPATDLPPMPPDVATLLAGGLGSCPSAAPDAPVVVNPYDEAPASGVNPYGS